MGDMKSIGALVEVLLKEESEKELKLSDYENLVDKLKEENRVLVAKYHDALQRFNKKIGELEQLICELLESEGDQ